MGREAKTERSQGRSRINAGSVVVVAREGEGEAAEARRRRTDPARPT